MKRNLAIQIVDRLFIVAYGATSPTDEEWSSYLGLVRLKSLLSERATQYETAHYTVDTSDCDVAEVVERTLAIVRGA
jgi:hypothetical protein